MPLYLVQHGKSLPKETDPDQGLSVEGKSDVTRIAEVAKHYGIKINSIQHSGKTRAQQTADIFASVVSPGVTSEKRSGINPLDDVTAVANGLDAGENLMLVGHLPFMERMTSFLITGSTEPRVFKFQNGGILCLDKESSASSWHIKWSLMPKID